MAKCIWVGIFYCYINLAINIDFKKPFDFAKTAPFFNEVG